ncbi:MgtC/SapB family protein [Bosea sp. BH3]|uniref:MgtC/SapB family protein n=1 Tax=Bosea sp. BH3 TaxID=2871701 RepID=UPI0021CAF41F|nr:MgtC/SapB family protein [Bosea sp. BH3]MCU4180664.1 MgtC/SapB family protein [Bosea sp. BH3]
MTELELILRLVAGLLAGVAIGWQRALRHKRAGIRTFGLVGLGTALAATLFDDATHPDAAGRVIQGVLTGIGFLGAGLIVRREDETAPHGLTTAAAVWVTAALGSAAGLGHWLVAFAATALALLLLALDHSIEHWARGRAVQPQDDEGAP